MENEWISFNYNETKKLTKGDLLISEPFMGDQNFTRSVVLICEHSEEEGSVGLMLNRPSNILVEDVAAQLSMENTLFVGGPVEQSSMLFIHKIPELEGSIALRDGVFWGGNFEHLISLSKAGLVKPDNARFFMGYSGWGGQQLRGELQEKSWIISDVYIGDILDTDPLKLWQHILRQMGGTFKVLSNFPADPTFN